MKPEIKLEYVGEASELIVREGQALPLKEPKIIAVTGVLNSPLRWLEKRVNEINQLTAHITVNRDKLGIALHLAEKDYYGDGIAGRLELHPMFVRFAINTDQYLSNFEMAKLFKMNRSAFDVQADAMKLVSELQNFRAKVAKDIEKLNDNRGNKTELTAQAVESNLPDRFVLSIPIFKGTPRRSFEVEVYIRAEDLSCTLVSPGANDLIEEMRDAEIDEVLEQIRAIAPDIVIIEQ